MTACMFLCLCVTWLRNGYIYSLIWRYESSTCFGLCVFFSGRLGRIPLLRWHLHRISHAIRLCLFLHHLRLCRLLSWTDFYGFRWVCVSAWVLHELRCFSFFFQWNVWSTIWLRSFDITLFNHFDCVRIFFLIFFFSFFLFLLSLYASKLCYATQRTNHLVFIFLPFMSCMHAWLQWCVRHKNQQQRKNFYFSLQLILHIVACIYYKSLCVYTTLTQSLGSNIFHRNVFMILQFKRCIHCTQQMKISDALFKLVMLKGHTLSCVPMPMPTCLPISACHMRHIQLFSSLRCH